MQSTLQDIKEKFEKEICTIHKQCVTIAETKDGLVVTSQCCPDFKAIIEIAMKREERELTEHLLKKHNQKRFE